MTKKKKAKLYYKEITLTPTDFTLQVFISKDFNTTVSALNKKIEKYDWRKFFDFDSSGFFVKYITEKNKVRFVICLYGFKYQSVAHEAVHVTWELARIVGFNLSEDEELQAYYVGYIVDEIMKMKK